MKWLESLKRGSMISRRYQRSDMMSSRQGTGSTSSSRMWWATSGSWVCQTNWLSSCLSGKNADPPALYKQVMLLKRALRQAASTWAQTTWALAWRVVSSGTFWSLAYSSPCTSGASSEEDGSGLWNRWRSATARVFCSEKSRRYWRDLSLPWNFCWREWRRDEMKIRLDREIKEAEKS